MKYRYLKLSVLILILAAISQVQAKDSLGLFNDGATPSWTMPGPAHAFSQTYGEWAAAWWQWALELDVPDAEHPLIAEGEVDCSLGKTKHVWFLAGTTVGPAERECSVPPGRPLFYPVLNAVWVNEEGDCDPSCPTVQEKRDELDFFFSTFTCNLYSEINGVPTGYMRAQSPAFSVEAANNIIVDAGTADEEAVADGFWVLVPPLPVGEHLIEFGGGFCDPETGDPFFEVSIAYYLTVKPNGH